MWQLRGCFVPQSGHRFPQMLRPVVNVRFGKAAPQRRDPRSMSAMGRVFRKQSCGSPKADFSCGPAIWKSGLFPVFSRALHQGPVQ